MTAPTDQQTAEYWQEAFDGMVQDNNRLTEQNADLRKTVEFRDRQIERQRLTIVEMSLNGQRQQHAFFAAEQRAHAAAAEAQENAMHMAEGVAEIVRLNQQIAERDATIQALQADVTRWAELYAERPGRLAQYDRLRQHP